MIGVLSRHIALRSSHFGGEELVAEALDILKETSQKITIFIKAIMIVVGCQKLMDKEYFLTNGFKNHRLQPT